MYPTAKWIDVSLTVELLLKLPLKKVSKCLDNSRTDLHATDNDVHVLLSMNCDKVDGPSISYISLNLYLSNTLVMVYDQIPTFPTALAVFFVLIPKY